MTNKLTTISPIDNSVYVERSYATPEEINATLDRAQQAQKIWKHVPLAQRKQLCTAMVDAFVAKKSEIAEESIVPLTSSKLLKISHFKPISSLSNK